MKRFLLIVCFLLPLSISAQWNTDNIMRVGQNAIYLDDYLRAIENFNQIIRVKPFLSEPYFFRGLAKLNLGDYDGSIKDFTDAIGQNPNYLHAYLYRGVAYNSLKRYYAAIDDYQTALELDPSNAYAHFCMGVTLSAIGKMEDAKKCYSKALRLDDQMVAAWLNRALVKDRDNDYSGALADCNTAIKLNMFSEEAYGFRAYLHLKNGDYHEAIEDCNRALSVNPNNVRTLMNRAMIWYEMKKYNETLSDYGKVLEIDSNYIYAYYNRAMLWAEAGNYAAAISDLDKAVDLVPNNSLVYFNRGMFKMETNDLDGAFYDFTECTRIFPDFAKAYIARSRISELKGNNESSRNDIRKAVDIMDRYKRMKEGDKSVLVDTSGNFMQLVDVNDSGSEVRNTVGGTSQDKNVMLRLRPIMSVYYTTADSLRAGTSMFYDKIVTDYNQDHNYNPALMISYKSGRDSSIIAKIDDVTKRIAVSANPDDLFLRGVLYLNLGDYMKAINDFEAISEKYKYYVLVRFNLANARVLMYDYVSSVKDAEGSTILGDNLNSDDVKHKVDYSDVVLDYNNCLALDKSFVLAQYNLANVYVKNGEIDRAIAAYTKAIEIDPYMAESYFNRGLLYVFVGKKALANVDLGKAGELGMKEAYNIIKRYCSSIND